MSQYRGYRGRSLEFLKTHNIAVGDVVSVESDMPYSGIIMPRYEHTDDEHIVLKLPSGYNVGLEIMRIKGIKTISEPPRQDMAGAVAGTGTMPAAPDMQSDLPRILLLTTGGTIASTIDYRTGAVRPSLTADELNASVPELAGIARIETEEVLSEYSENIVPSHWQQIARRAGAHAESGYAGIIIAHGTDTMHYTSAFLSFALAGIGIPIVLVGSQRSSDRASSDAAMNLIGAARFITGNGTAGVFIAMHLDESDNAVACHLGTRARKNHTSRRGAFQTMGAEPAFIITSDGIRENFSGRFFDSGTFKPRINLDERVALVKYHPGFDPRLLDRMADMGYRGIIFEGTGLGHVGNTTYQSIKNARDAGMFVGMTSQCMDGRVSMTVYESGRDLLGLGVVPLRNMIPEVALVKAMWAFGNMQDAEQVEGAMLHTIASEMA